MSIRYRLARLADLPNVVHLLEQGAVYLKEQGIKQWQGDIQWAELIRESIVTDQAFVWEKDKSMVAFAVLAPHDPYYTPQKNWHSESPYYAIHRVVVSSKYRGQGIMTQVFKDIEAIAQSHRIQTLRIDTHQDNVIMQHLIKKQGFIEVGEVTVANNEPRIAFDKMLKIESI